MGTLGGVRPGTSLILLLAMHFACAERMRQREERREQLFDYLKISMTHTNAGMRTVTHAHTQTHMQYAHRIYMHRGS